MLVFAVGECLHGAIHAPLSVDLAPPQLVGRYLAASSISWQIGWIVGPAAGGFLLQHRPLLLWPIAAGGQPRLRGGRARRSSRGCPSGCAGRRMAKPLRSCQLRRAGSIPGPCQRPPTPSVPMPSLPRIRSRRAVPGHSGRRDAAGASLSFAPAGVTWVHLLSPDARARRSFSPSRFGWHPLDVEDVLSRRQRPKVDVYSGDEDGDGGYLFAVLHFPVYDKTVGRLNAGELDVFLGPDYLVTLPSVELRPGQPPLPARGGERGVPRAAPLARLGPAALRGARRPLRLLLPDPRQDRLQARADRRGDRGGPRARRSSSPTSTRSSRRSSPTARSSSRSGRRSACSSARSSAFLPEELELYFDDIVDASERIWDLLDNYKEVVEALEDTNESLISHQQNDILYVLTIFSVVLLPLTFLTGFFGMNVHFPGFDSLGRVLGAPRTDGGHHRRHARLLPLEALALSFSGE